VDLLLKTRLFSALRRANGALLPQRDPGRGEMTLSQRQAPGRTHALRQVWRNMFVIELVYKADLSEIDAHMKAHVAFLKKYYAAGIFLVSGRKIPRDGGIIMAVCDSREKLEAIVQEDPFHSHGLADFRIIEFRASQRGQDIQARIDDDVRASS
jgi:uncharacterized protein YciI